MERMQTLQNLQRIKMSRYQRNVSFPHQFLSLQQEFEQNVLKDQATSVFLVANARILSKAQALN